MRILNKADLEDRGIRLDDSSLWRKMKAGDFPKAVMVGNRRGWIESEIDNYIASLVAKRDASVKVTDVDEQNSVGDGRKTAKTDAVAESA